MKYKAIMLIVILLMAGCAVSVPASKGCIIKYVFYDDLPLEGAFVEIWGERGDRMCPGDYTGPDGSVSFCELEYGTYYIYVDWDNDGVWDTVEEMVVLDSSVESICNYYYPLEAEDEDCTHYIKNMK